MIARSAVRLLVVAGTLVPAIAAFADPSAAQLLPTSTTVELPTTTTSTTTTTSSTTTTAPGDTASEDSTTTTTSTTPDELVPPDEGTESDLLGGGLSISGPSATELSADTPLTEGTLTASLGAITVTDDRVGLVAGWTVAVSASDFEVDGAPAETAIPPTSIRYRSGPATATSGTAMFVPGQTASDPAQHLGLPRTAFSAVTSSGGTSATWNPTIVVELPSTAISGQYHGTITHSVA
jgi:hypothetical protein